MKQLPTDAELAVLAVLWAEGPSTVRTVHDALEHESRTAYTTTLKIMQIMHEKGLVKRDESQRSHVYRAAVAERDVQRSLVSELIGKAFSGSAAQMVQRALSVKKTSREEIDEIRRLLDDLEKRGR
jgi:BlaI family transcriptional regulator, penicillinase repressor